MDESIKHIIEDLKEKKRFYEANKEYGAAAGIAIAMEIIRGSPADEDIY